MRWEREGFMGVTFGEHLRLTARERNHLTQTINICERARGHYETDSEDDDLLAYAMFAVADVLEQLVDELRDVENEAS